MKNNNASKVLAADTAVRTFVRDGDCLAIGGFVTNRRPYVLVREVIRQGVKNLYMEGGAAGGDLDMLIGTGQVEILINSYAANAGYTQVCRRFRAAIEEGENSLLYDDYSMDVQAIVYHGAALGLSYIPVKNMLGSDLCNIWGISEEQRKKYPKLPPKKFVIEEDPFNPGSRLCCVPCPKIDVAFIHAQKAGPDGTFRIEGPVFLDLDLAIAAKHTIVTCEELLTNEEMHRHPELNTCTGLCVDAVVQAPYGAHPTQCFGMYDYDSTFLLHYDKVSRTQNDFNNFIKEYVTDCPTHDDYLKKIGEEHLTGLHVDPEYGYKRGLKRR